MLDLYWTYLTQGVVDITSVISTPASDLRACAHRLGGDLSITEDVTGMVSEVTTGGSGDAAGQDAVRPDPPRAGRSRPSRPSAYIPVGTPSVSEACRPGVRHSFGQWPVEAVVPAATRCTCGQTVRGGVPRGTGGGNA